MVNIPQKLDKKICNFFLHDFFAKTYKVFFWGFSQKCQNQLPLGGEGGVFINAQMKRDL